MRRVLTCVLGLASTALAVPPLTTIQDVLYKADGTRFTGTALVTWNGFEAADASNISTQSVVVKIVNGNLFVRLVPTEGAVPAASYSVKYNSDGKIQFQETWGVPATGTKLRVRDVRTSAPPPSSVTQILESDVLGLVNDLTERPIKGTGYTPSHAAFINSSGAVDAVIGSPSDCVRVDGTSGPCGSFVVLFVDAEVPGGVVDGANASFSLSFAPAPSTSLALFRNGILQKVGVDYSLSGGTIAFLSVSIPVPGDILLASYRH
jgi:hypothetical protein